MRNLVLHMLNISRWLIVLCCVSDHATAQPPAFFRRPAVGLHVVCYDFKGADSLSLFGQHIKTGLALNLQNNITAKWAYNLAVEGAFIDFADRKNRLLHNGDKQLLVQAGLSLRRYWVAPGHFCMPYIQAGGGVSKFNAYYGGFVSTEAGLQLNVTANLFVIANAGYRMPVTNTQHRHFIFSIGLAGPISRKKIISKYQAKPVTVTVLPLVDTDGDGLTDNVDSCPLVPGAVRYHGCPVPDSDKDGVNDENDECPQQPGTVMYHGCPPPDRIHDEGKEIRSTIQMAAQNIFFETGSYILLPKSYAALNEVVTILLTHTTLQLSIEGHTDNTGTIAGNRLLSQNRAQTVLNYLANKGVNRTRLQAVGFGESRPVAGNSTAEGRAKNRRVEMKVADQ